MTDIEKKHVRHSESLIGMKLEAAMSFLEVKEGLSVQYVFETLDAMNETDDVFTCKRSVLEKSTDSIHFIPYVQVVYNSTGDFLTYKRPSQQNGEFLLEGKHSLGIGGHPDGRDNHYDSRGVFLLRQSIYRAAVRECDEELKYTINGARYSLSSLLSETPDLARLVPVGFIRDTSDKVGQTHLGVFFVLALDPMIKVESKDPTEVIDIQWMSRHKARDGQTSGVLCFEGWSKIILDTLDQ